MSTVTDQMNVWQSDFGKDYTDRNPQTFIEMNELYEKNFGITRSSLNETFLGDIDRSIKILEVGANVGSQLQCLQQMGFRNLYGIELQRYAVKEARRRTENINLVQGTAFDIPFKDGFFDLVFTSGVLIHISPDDIHGALSEICRCTNRYIWGCEYYSKDYESIPYRGRDDLLWKTDFAGLYQNSFSGISLVEERLLPYVEGDNCDAMFLLKKE